MKVIFKGSPDEINLLFKMLQDPKLKHREVHMRDALPNLFRRLSTELEGEATSPPFTPEKEGDFPKEDSCLHDSYLHKETEDD